MIVQTVFLATLCGTVHGGNVQGVAVNNTLTLGYLVPWAEDHEWEIGPYVGSAIILGIEEVHRRQLLPGYDIEWILRDDYCEKQRGMQVGAVFYITGQKVKFTSHYIMV